MSRQSLAVPKGHHRVIVCRGGLEAVYLDLDCVLEHLLVVAQIMGLQCEGIAVGLLGVPVALTELQGVRMLRNGLGLDGVVQHHKDQTSSLALSERSDEPVHTQTTVQLGPLCLPDKHETDVGVATGTYFNVLGDGCTCFDRKLSVQEVHGKILAIAVLADCS